MNQYQTLKIKNIKIKAPQNIIKNLQNDLDEIFTLIHLIGYNLDLHFFPSFKNKKEGLVVINISGKFILTFNLINNQLISIVLAICDEKRKYCKEEFYDILDQFHIPLQKLKHLL